MNRPAEPIIWSDDLATGVAEIDEQHKILVHEVNEASAKLSRESSTELLMQITRDLLSYALYHFEMEEGLMQTYAYMEGAEDEAKDHLKQHRVFSERVVKVYDGLKSATPIEADELLDFLNSWLLDHIQNTDQKLARFIIEKQAQKSDI